MIVMDITPQRLYDRLVVSLNTGSYRVSGEEIIVVCPYCDDVSGHMYVNIKKRLFNCFHCNAGGSIRECMVGGMGEWSDVLRNVERSTKVSPFLPQGKLIPILTPPEQKVTKADKLDKSRIMAFAYCKARGLTYGQVVTHRVSYTNYDDRVFFPYWEEDGKVSFCTCRHRIVGQNESKTMHTTGEKPLYGRHIRRYCDYVFLVEGVFDYFATPRSYAVLGHSVSDYQLRLLNGDGIRVVFLLFDRDVADELSGVARKLSENGFVVVRVIMDGFDDPADAGRRVMAKVVNYCLDSVGIDVKRSQQIKVNASIQDFG